MAIERVELNIYDGRLSTVTPSLRQSIAGFIRHNRYVKIGITSDPVGRADKHSAQNPNWERMVLLYESASINNVSTLEAEMVDHFWDDVENEKGGGGGNYSDSGPYYLYVLLRK